MYTSRDTRNLLVGCMIMSSVASVIRRNDFLPKQLSLAPRAECNGFDGNGDLYGLGIRLGIYLQWISSLVTSVLLPTGSSDLLDTNSIFLFAVFVATATATHRNGGLHPAEAFIMLQLCFGFLLSVLSVSGFRLALLRDKIRLDPKLLSSSKGSAAVERLFPLEKPRLGHKIIADPPDHIKQQLRTSTAFWLKVTDVMTFLILASETATPSYFSRLWASVLEPMLCVVDFTVYLSLPPDKEEIEPDDNAVERFRKERLLNYKRHRQYVAKCRNPRLFSLALTSVFKGDQISWTGILWRSTLVGGISIYNVWYWFHGVEFLTTNSCTIYIFFFCRMDITGPVRAFFKFISIGYITYSGSLILVCFYTMMAFMQTTYRSLYINLITLSYAHIMLFCPGFGSKKLKRRLSDFQQIRSKFQDWLGVPSMDKLLKAVAYLASHPEEGKHVVSDAQTDIKEGRKMEPDGRDNSSDPKKSQWTQVMKGISLFVAVGMVIWSIITVELTLVYNSINGIYTIRSTGQLIPFIIGVAGLGKTLHELCINSIKRTYPDWSNIKVYFNAMYELVIEDSPLSNDDLAKPTKSQVDVPAVVEETEANVLEEESRSKDV